MPMNYQLTSAFFVPPADRDEEFVGCFDWTDEVVCAVIAGEFRRAYDLCRSSIRTGTTKADLHRLLSTLRAFRDDAEEVSPKFRDALKEFRAWLNALQPAYAADQSNSAASPLIIMACRRLYRRLAFLARAQLELSIDLANNGCDEALERASRAIDDLDAVEALLRWKGVETNSDFSRWLRSQLRASVRMRNGGE